jgi:hypothetical protein
VLPITAIMGLPMLRIVILVGRLTQSLSNNKLRDCQCFALSSPKVRLTQSLSNNKLRDCQCFALSSPKVRLTQSLSNNSRCESFGFFAFRLFTKASFRHSLKTKKPLTCVRGFVARPGFELVTSGL